MTFVSALIATKPRWSSLLATALPSLMKQVRAPDELVVVADGRKFTETERATLLQFTGGLPLRLLQNSRLAGAAGTWNTGLNDIRARHPLAYVAILDDDDEWDPEHLQCCIEVAEFGKAPADVVVSGLRLLKDGREIHRSPLASVSIVDFLVGNPGWQGSNTFATVAVMARAGNFTDGLPSTNDRDLAIRLLSLDNLDIRFTGRMTATWHLRHRADALSTAGPREKLLALERFLDLHKHRMSESVRADFNERCKRLFGVTVPN